MNSPYYARHVPRTRRLVGLLSALTLVAIAVGVAGFELPLPRSSATSSSALPPLPGVRAAASSVLLRVGNGAPPGGDLAFLAIEPTGNLVVSDRARAKVLRFDSTDHL